MKVVTGSERFDGDDVGRILRRAQDLEHRAADSDDAAGISPDAVIEAAAEVGIDRDAVRDSLAIERLETYTPEPKRLDRLGGPAVVTVERVMPMGVGESLEVIETWLTTRHRLRCIPQADGSLRFHRRTDTAASIGRRVSGLRGEGRLGTLKVITVRAVPQVVGTTPESPRSLVAVQADRDAPRRSRLSGGAAIGLAGIGGAVVLAAESVTLGPIAAIPTIGVGYLVARSGRAQSDRVELELERLLSDVERGLPPTWRARRSRRSRHWTGAGRAH